MLYKIPFVVKSLELRVIVRFRWKMEDEIVTTLTLGTIGVPVRQYIVFDALHDESGTLSSYVWDLCLFLMRVCDKISQIHSVSNRDNYKMNEYTGYLFFIVT